MFFMTRDFEVFLLYIYGTFYVLNLIALLPLYLALCIQSHQSPHHPS